MRCCLGERVSAWRRRASRAGRSAPFARAGAAPVPPVATPRDLASSNPRYPELLKASNAPHSEPPTPEISALRAGLVPHHGPRSARGLGRNSFPTHTLQPHPTPASVCGTGLVPHESFVLHPPQHVITCADPHRMPLCISNMAHLTRRQRHAYPRSRHCLIQVPDSSLP